VELIEAGYEVAIIDDLSNSRIEVLQGIRDITGHTPHFEEFNLCDRRCVSDFFKQYRDIQAVIHFAAYKSVGESVRKPLAYYENNIVSLCNLLREMQHSGTRKLVFSSSCTVYGEPDRLPVTESSPVKKAGSPYGNTKQISEEIIEDTIRSGMPLSAVSLRYFNPIGAHPSGLIGELPQGIPNNLVPFITQTAAGVLDELSVFGDDYNTPDGTAIRDYINVTDLSKAHVVAIERLLRHNNLSDYEVFNLGTGQGATVMGVIRSFEKATCVKIKYRITGRREGDVEKVFADTSLANRELGWKATTTLEDTLLSAWNWEKNFRKLE
jgi:UDP-glucose 4-epimerase